MFVPLLLVILNGCASSPTRSEQQLSTQLAHNADLHDIVIGGCLKAFALDRQPMELKIEYEMNATGEMKSVQLIADQTHGSTPQLNQCILAGLKNIHHGTQIGGGSRGNYRRQFSHE